MANFTCSHIVLAGGRSRRLNGVTKSLLLFGGKTLLEHALDAAPRACHRVVVGPDSLLWDSRAGHDGPDPPQAFSLVSEDPPFGGPVAGMAAGVGELDRLGCGSDWILVTACDHPRAPAAATALFASVTALLADPGPVDLVAPTDSSGQQQILFALYRRRRLTAALAAVGGGRDVSVRRLVSQLRTHVPVLPDGLLGDVDDPAAAVRAGVELPQRPPIPPR